MNTNGLLENIARFKTGRSKRISSYARGGSNNDFITIGAGETVDIAHIRGAGVIKHIWITTGHEDPMHYRHMVLRMYWDDETKPSVESPLGDFFGQGWGEVYPYAALPICAAPQRSLNCYLPMPFRRSARIEIENDSEHRCAAFYYYVDYEERDLVEAELGYFHAHWRRRLNKPAEDRENEWLVLGNPHPANLTDAHNHTIIDAVGRGHYIGVNYYVDCPTPIWYGEGDDMFFIDGEKWPPSLHGTGTEDYFNTSYSPKVVFCHPYFGFPRVNNDLGWLGRTHCYRFHIEDPIIFQKSIRGSIEAGHAGCLTLDLATVAYWYQTEPHKAFGPFPNRKGRANMPKIETTDIHNWRAAWRELQGGGTLWGNEPLPKKFLKKLADKGASGRKRLAPAANQTLAAIQLAAQEKMLNRRKRKTARK
ncbi:MAG: DUF2961 domain-containing protein [Verrucomicrobiae bacterium]|nr:DUF2961 domain-containing protein [Verrucomicrobiae bacterium]